MRRALVLLILAVALTAGRSAVADPAAEGKALFEQKCTACHSVGAGDRVGPDLAGVTERRSQEWFTRFVSAPEKMIEAKDEVAVRLYEKYNRIVMPSLDLKEDEAQALFAFLRSAGAAAPSQAKPAPAAPLQPEVLGAAQSKMLTTFLIISAVIAMVFLWIGLSTRNPAEVDVKRAYSLRAGLFVAATVVVVAILAVTLPGAPYAAASTKADRIVYVAARQFEFVFSDEPVTSVADLGRVATRRELDIPAGTLVEFRVTGLDVTHGFGIYGPRHELVAQTQAMPGYFNRLLVQLPEAGSYKVLCLEYCAAGHHVMQTNLTVK